MQTQATKMIHHQWTDRCNREMEIQLQMRDVKIAPMAGEMKSRLYDREDDPLVEGVTRLQYLGWTLEETDSDTVALANRRLQLKETPRPIRNCERTVAPANQKSWTIASTN